MIDAQTYRVRIGSAPTIVGRILLRKAASFKSYGGETHHEDEDLLRKKLKTVTVFQLCYFLHILLVIILTVSKYTDLKYFVRTNYAYDAIFSRSVQYVFSWTPIKEGADEFLAEGTTAIFCTGLCVSQIGAVHFISILLLMAGIEPNPGPTSGTENTKSDTGTNEQYADVFHDVKNDTDTTTPKPITTTVYHNEMPMVKDAEAQCDIKKAGEPAKSEASSIIKGQQVTNDHTNFKDVTSGLEDLLTNSGAKPKEKNAWSTLRRKLTPKFKTSGPPKVHSSLLQISTSTIDYIQERNEDTLTEETIDSVFIKKEDSKVTLCLRNMDMNQEKFDMILSEIDLPTYDVNEIDLCYSTFCLMSWSEHPDGYTNLQKLLSHPRLNYLKTINLDMGKFSRHDKGGLLVSLKNKKLTIPDLRMLHKLLTSVMQDFEVSCVDMHTSVICQKSWGDSPDGPQLLDDLLRHPRLKGAPVLGLEHIGLTTLPESIAIHHCLTDLNISNNQLTSVDESITVCRFLVDLNMSVNQLVKLPDPFDFPKLETLNVEENPMYEITAVHVQLPSLKTLMIGGPETRTINRQLVGHIVTTECDIQVNANYTDKLKAPTFKQLTKNPDKYMVNYDRTVEQLKGNC